MDDEFDIGTLIKKRKPFDINEHINKNGYSQRDWDRTVGIGTVPEEYKLTKKESS